MSSANSSAGFSVLADETTDISGREQLSLGVRFVDVQNGAANVREEFLGFVELNDRSDAGTACSIATVYQAAGLNMQKLVGQGLRLSGLFSCRPFSLGLSPGFYPGPDHQCRLFQTFA